MIFSRVSRGEQSRKEKNKSAVKWTVAEENAGGTSLPVNAGDDDCMLADVDMFLNVCSRV